jgi:hypothetical protein
MEPDFLTGPELARRLGMAKTETLDRWVAKGEFPPPWVYVGPRKRFWRADHYEAFRVTGQWPGEAWKGTGGL